MNKAVCIKTGLEEHVLSYNNKQRQSQIDGIRTPVHLKSEEIDIKHEPLEIVSGCSVVEDERQYTRIKRDVQDEDFSGSKNKDFQIATQVDKVHSSISPVEDIKSEDIDIKNELLDDFGLPFTENGDTLSITCNQTSDDATKSDDVLKHDNLHLEDCKIIGSSFEMKYKDDAEENALASLPCSEIPICECNICRYKTRRKSHLRRYTLVHKDPSETAMYECNICLYKTRHRSNLYKHMLVHKDPSELTMYECNTCQYKTRWKSYLKKHVLNHMDPAKIAMHECNICLFKTQHKINLRKHMLVHKDPSEITMYECNTCHHKTRRKTNLQAHMLVHMNPKRRLNEINTVN